MDLLRGRRAMAAAAVRDGDGDASYNIMEIFHDSFFCSSYLS